MMRAARPLGEIMRCRDDLWELDWWYVCMRRMNGSSGSTGGSVARHVRVYSESWLYLGRRRPRLMRRHFYIALQTRSQKRRLHALILYIVYTRFTSQCDFNVITSSAYRLHELCI